MLDGRSGAERRRRTHSTGISATDCSEYSFELVAAGITRDLAYTVGCERSVVSVDGDPHAEHAACEARLHGEWKSPTVTGARARRSKPTEGRRASRRTDAGVATARSVCAEVTKETERALSSRVPE